MTYHDDEEPLASWKAVLLPDWEWEACDEEEDGLYFGRANGGAVSGFLRANREQ